MNPRIAIVIACLALSGCATPAYKDITAAQTVAVGDGITVAPQIEWGQANMAGFRGTLWTVDGVGLDALLFFIGYPGRPLIEMNGAKQNLQLYQSTMLPDDVMEFTASNFASVGFLQVKTNNLRPASFGTAKGFRFDMAFTDKNGLEMKGMALACQRNGRMDMIVFTAPAEYYFSHYAPTVDRIFASVQVAG